LHGIQVVLLDFNPFSNCGFDVVPQLVNAIAYRRKIGIKQQLIFNGAIFS
jgi:hypothetical protein